MKCIKEENATIDDCYSCENFKICAEYVGAVIEEQDRKKDRNCKACKDYGDCTQRPDSCWNKLED